jgi:hypothetical protein
MLRSIDDLKDYSIKANDGSVGEVKDFLFDDLAWVIRYFVVETGTWLASRKVLISPIAIQEPNGEEKNFPVSLTMEQVMDSPDIDTDKPVSRQHEIDYHRYYGYSYYWGGAGFWGEGMYPYSLYPSFASSPLDQEGSPVANRAHDLAQHIHDEDPNLRSCEAIIGYHIHLNDGDLGHVSGFIVDEGTWAVRYLIADTSNWWGGHKVLISPEWIEEVRWADNSVSIDLSRQSVKDAPVFESTQMLDRQYEEKIFHHYERVAYWPEF